MRTLSDTSSRLVTRVSLLLRVLLCFTIVGVAVANIVLSKRLNALSTDAGYARNDDALPDVTNAQMVLFYSPSCDACAEVRSHLLDRLAEVPDVRCAQVNSTLKGAFDLRDAFNHVNHVPPEHWSSVPILFAEGRYFIGERSISTQLPTLFKQLHTLNARR